MSVASNSVCVGNQCRTALRIAAVYAVFGILYILFSDLILAALIDNPATITRVQTAKGWLFILSTAILIYWLVRRYLADMIRTNSLLVQSEQRYRAIVETSQEGIALTNPDHNLVFLNPRMGVMLGYRVEELRDKPLSALFDRDPNPSTRELLSQAESRTAQQCDIHLRRQDGGDLWAIASVCPLYDDQRRYMGILLMLTDITERKSLQDDLIQAQKLEAVGRLAGGIAHDFNNLLMAIFGYTDLARRALQPDHPALQSLNGVLEAAEQAAGVSKALLTFSHKAPIDRQNINMVEVIEKSTRLLKRLLPASIELSVEIPKKTAAWVFADPVQMQQVIMNLAINAKDAMPGGGILRITIPPPADADRIVAKAITDYTGPCFCMIVSDTGVGMSPEVRANAFKPFFTTKLQGKGTGLGLAIIHSIIKEHHGTIQIESEPGQGTTFTIVLPAAAEKSDFATPSVLSPPRGDGELILLAEDNAHVRAITASALTASGYEVVQVSDGASLLEAYTKNRERVRLIVSDAEMPQKNGVDCLKDLRQHGVQIPAILTTGSIATELEDRLDDRTSLLQKPYQVNALVTMVSYRLNTESDPVFQIPRDSSSPHKEL